MILFVLQPWIPSPHWRCPAWLGWMAATWRPAVCRASLGWSVGADWTIPVVLDLRPRNVTQLCTSSRIVAVSCDNQTISYTGTVYDLMLRALGCPHSGVTKCPPMRGNIARSIAIVILVTMFSHTFMSSQS